MLCYCFYSISSALVGVDVEPGETFQKNNVRVCASNFCEPKAQV